MYMKEALKLAHTAQEKGEVPVGAVIVSDGIILAWAHNEVEARKEATAHAEMLALQEAAAKLSQRILDRCDIYVTLEPCPMCAYALSLARIRRVYFGAYDVKGGGVDHGPKIFAPTYGFHKPEVYGGLEESACRHLLQDFFKRKR